jgi:hypothetical protein
MKLRNTALALAVLAGSVGVAAAQDYRYYDRDGYRYERGYRGGFREGMRAARQTGFQDGAQVAREDMWRGKPFNPNPRGRYDDADHGYRREYGDRHEYREHYSASYREGYQSTFRYNGYGRNGYGRDAYWR